MEDTSAARPRTILPIPDVAPVGLTTYDAKDPGTSFPPIAPLLRRRGTPNVLIVLLDRPGHRLRLPPPETDRRDQARQRLHRPRASTIKEDFQ
jgi:hypothetical protein